MPKITAYIDAKGNIYRTPAESALSDMAAALGGDTNIPMAKTIMANRSRIEAIFKDYDECVGPGRMVHDAQDKTNDENVAKPPLDLTARDEVDAGSEPVQSNSPIELPHV